MSSNNTTPTENEQLELLCLAERFCAYYRIIFNIMDTKVFDSVEENILFPDIGIYTMEKLRLTFQQLVDVFFPVDMKTTTLSETTCNAADIKNKQTKMIFGCVSKPNMPLLSDNNADIQTKYQKLIRYFKKNPLKIKNDFYEKTVADYAFDDFAQLTLDFSDACDKLFKFICDINIAKVGEIIYKRNLPDNILEILDMMHAFNKLLDNNC